MIEQTLHKVTKELEHIVTQGISLHRALDLIEATSQSLEEIMALNLLRESLEEIGEVKPKTKSVVLPQMQGTQRNLAYA